MVVTDRDVERWLREDLGHHDVGNDLPGQTQARLVATESGVLAGITAATAVFEYLDVTVDHAASVGDRVSEGEAVLTVSGPAQAILRGERVATNVIAHASGIATATRNAVDAARTVSDAITIAATRKTTPGLRGVEKRAVAAGGGDTHRLDLSHAVMIKDNHIAAYGREEAVKRFQRRKSFTTPLEIELADPTAAADVAVLDVDTILLDNMSPAEVTQAVQTIADIDETITTEASGGIDHATLPEYAATGVDVISMGWLTHSAPAIDYSFRVAPK